MWMVSSNTCLARGGGLPLPPDVDPSQFRLPPGYLEADVGQEDLRSEWTTEPQHVPPNTWTTDNCMKYSTQEMLGRGETADDIVRQGLAGELSRTAVVAALRQLGVKGSTMFTCLSYFKCAPSSSRSHTFCFTSR